MKLSERAVLVSLSVGVWSNTRTDREVSDEVSEQHNAEKGAGTYKKYLISPKAFVGVNRTASAARATNKLLTLPWTDDGVRILATRGHQHHSQQMRTKRLAFEASVLQFKEHFPEHIEEAKARLGTMFKGEDYPTPEQVFSKFSFDVEIRQVPEAGDFRAALNDDQVKAVVKDIERRTKERLEAAVADIYSRITDVTGKMMTRLREYDPEKGRLQDSLVMNIHEVAEMIPVLNITEDAKLDELSQQLKDQLLEFSPEILKQDAKARKTVSDRAEKLYNKAKKYLG